MESSKKKFDTASSRGLPEQPYQHFDGEIWLRSDDVPGKKDRRRYRRLSAICCLRRCLTRRQLLKLRRWRKESMVKATNLTRKMHNKTSATQRSTTTGAILIGVANRVHNDIHSKLTSMCGIVVVGAAGIFCGVTLSGLRMALSTNTFVDTCFVGWPSKASILRYASPQVTKASEERSAVLQENKWKAAECMWGDLSSGMASKKRRSFQGRASPQDRQLAYLLLLWSEFQGWVTWCELLDTLLRRPLWFSRMKPSERTFATPCLAIAGSTKFTVWTVLSTWRLTRIVIWELRPLANLSPNAKDGSS